MIFNKQRKQLEKMTMYYFILNDWLRVEQKGIYVKWYFKAHNYKKIGIYGCAELGQRLWDELKNQNYDVFVFDKKAKKYYNYEFSIYDPQTELENHVLDVMVVTAAYDYEFIKNDLKKQVSYPIISIAEIINDLYSGKYPVDIR